MVIAKPKAGFLMQSWSILSCLPKTKVNTSEKCVASEKKRVRYSMLQQLLGENIVVLPQLRGEP